MQMLHFRVPTSCNGMRLNIFLRTMGVSSACIKAVKDRLAAAKAAS